MERRLFEDLLDSDRVAHRTHKSRTLPVSVALHVIAAALVVLVPLLAGGNLPDPASSVKAFFVEPMTAPPPPPPPPPAPRAAVVRHEAPKPVPQTSKFVAPVEVPQEIKPEQALDLGVEGGVAGGVEGGVPGGVVGGVVGGLPDAPPPAVVKPVRVGGDIRPPRKLVDVAAAYPPLAVR